MWNFTCHSCDFKDKQMISRSSTTVGVPIPADSVSKLKTSEVGPCAEVGEQILGEEVSKQSTSQVNSQIPANTILKASLLESADEGDAMEVVMTSPSPNKSSTRVSTRNKGKSGSHVGYVPPRRKRKVEKAKKGIREVLEAVWILYACEKLANGLPMTVAHAELRAEHPTFHGKEVPENLAVFFVKNGWET
ncbi:unnamed protein product [Calypogeia fissa]